MLANLGAVGPWPPDRVPRGSTPGTLPGATGRRGDHLCWQHPYQDPDESWPAWYAACLVAEQAGTGLPA